MGAEGDEPLGFLPLRPPQNPLHCTAQVVIPHAMEYPAKIGERQLMRLQKRLLAGMRIRPVKGPAARHASHAEQVRFLCLAAIDLDPGLVPVHLAFLPPPITLRNEDVGLSQAQFLLAQPHVTPHRRFPNVDFGVLRLQPAPDPMRGVPLLPWRLPVRFQHLLDKRRNRRQLGLVPLRNLPRRRKRISDCVPHHPPMNTELPRHSFDRPHAVLILSSHLLK